MAKIRLYSQLQKGKKWTGGEASMVRINGFREKQTENKKVCDNRFLCRCKYYFLSFSWPSNTLREGRGFIAVSFSDIPAFKEIRKALKRLLPASDESQMCLL